MADWRDNLQPASWRGIPFAVIDSAIRRGRRTAVHEYVGRDTVWVEDLGRGTRRLAFRGFLLGDDVAQQEAAMLYAAELPDSGELVHPTLGSISASLIEFSAGQRREMGRVCELDFNFIETTAKLYPTGATSTQDAVNAAADNVDAASQQDFFSRCGTLLREGANVVHAVVSTVNGYYNFAQGLIGDANRAINAVRGIGSIVGVNVGLGRYSGGNLLALPPVVTAAVFGLNSTVARVQGATGALLGAAVAGTTAVRNAGLNIVALAQQL